MARICGRFVVELWPAGAAVPSDCIPDFFETREAAEEAGRLEIERAADMWATGKGDNTYDWAVKFTVRECEDSGDVSVTAAECLDYFARNMNGVANGEGRDYSAAEILACWETMPASERCEWEEEALQAKIEAQR
jgi:hypothetical protein